MANWNDTEVCYPHMWTGEGRCPMCIKESKQKRANEIKRWNSLTTKQKLQELHEKVILND